MDALDLKEAIRSGKVVTGFQQFTPSPAIAEIAGRAGFDFIMIDCEHGTTGYGTDLENMVRAANVVNAVPIVRISDIEHWIIMKSIETGAKGIIAPRVKTREDVEKAIRATKYYPEGDRGYCPASRAFMYWPEDRSRHIRDQNASIINCALIEQKEAVDNIEDIVQVEGLDFVFYGSGDLSVSLGVTERLFMGDEEVLGMLEGYRQRVLKACKATGMPMAQIPRSVEHAHQLIDEGIKVLITGPDTGWYYRIFSDYVSGIKNGG